MTLLPQDRKIRRTGTDAWVTLCDFHDDTNPSMGVRKYADGAWRYHCFACGASGDPVDYIRLTKGVSFLDACAELIGKVKNAPARPERTVAATYNYQDADGNTLYQVLRYVPKDFRQRRPSSDGWIWNLKDVPRVLYNLPAVLSANPAQTLYYVEGEKDVNTLAGKGLLATTHAGGVASWRDSLLAPLAGPRRRIVVVPDCDDPGRTMMRKVFAAARAAGHDARFVLLPFPHQPDHGKDVTDYFNEGGTVAGLEGMIK